jgi:hypothetical protein
VLPRTSTILSEILLIDKGSIYSESGPALSGKQEPKLVMTGILENKNSTIGNPKPSK